VERWAYMEKERKAERRERGKFVEGAMWGRCKII